MYTVKHKTSGRIVIETPDWKQAWCAVVKDRSNSLYIATPTRDNYKRTSADLWSEYGLDDGDDLLPFNDL